MGSVLLKKIDVHLFIKHLQTNSPQKVTLKNDHPESTRFLKSRGIAGMPSATDDNNELNLFITENFAIMEKRLAETEKRFSEVEKHISEVEQQILNVDVRTLVRTSMDDLPVIHLCLFGCGLVVNSAPTRQPGLGPHS